MGFDFDKITDRRGTGSLKWNVQDSELPMWVADMDFETAPVIREAILKRANHGVFGYAELGDEWYDAYRGWWARRHDVEIRKEELIYVSGVVPTISSAVRKLTAPAEQIIVLTPVYNIFFNSIINNGRVPLEIPLWYENGSYDLDLSALEEAFADPQTSMMLLCNPHNPVGKVWDYETLFRIAELANKYGVKVLSDEIHGDIIDPGKEYHSYLSLPPELTENAVVCIAPTKAFNIAGIQTAAAVVRNSKLRYQLWRGINNDEVGEPNAFAVDATVAAFTQGEEWLDALREYLYQNKLFTRQFVEKEISELKITPSEATYLLWINCDRVEHDSRKLSEYIRSGTGLYLSYGAQFGMGGEGFLRLNYACPRATLEDGLRRLDDSMLHYAAISGLQRR